MIAAPPTTSIAIPNNRGQARVQRRVDHIGRHVQLTQRRDDTSAMITADATTIRIAMDTSGRYAMIAVR